jgi:hypothetical protein
MVRDKIQASALITRLEKIAAGKVTAEPHQVTAALGLLKKVLPDLTATDLSSGGEAINVQLVQYAGGAQGVAIGAKPRARGLKAARNITQQPCDITQQPCDIMLPGGINPDREPASLVSLPAAETGAKMPVGSL